MTQHAIAHWHWGEAIMTDVRPHHCVLYKMCMQTIEVT